MRNGLDRFVGKRNLGTDLREVENGICFLQNVISINLNWSLKYKSNIYLTKEGWNNQIDLIYMFENHF